MAANIPGKLPTDRDNRYGYEMPESDKASMLVPA